MRLHDLKSLNFAAIVSGKSLYAFLSSIEIQIRMWKWRKKMRKFYSFDKWNLVRLSSGIKSSFFKLGKFYQKSTNRN